MSGGDYDDVEELEEKLEAYKRTCLRAKGTYSKTWTVPTLCSPLELAQLFPMTECTNTWL